MHELWLVKKSKMINISPLVGSIKRRSNKDELGEELSFDIAFNDDKHFPKNPCEIGDMVILKNNNKEITRAIIEDEDRKGRDPISYTAFDFAFYLNKSNAVYQFNKIPADQAIKKILNDFSIPIGNIASMPTKIDKIFNDKKVSDIIKEIIKITKRNTGTKYLMEMRDGKLFIEKRNNMVVTGEFQLYKNGSKHDVVSAISNPSRKRSISDMINSIQVVSSKDKVLLTKENEGMVKKYGKLQKVVKLDEKEKLTAKQIAQNELDDLAKVVEETSIELIGDDRVRAGRLFKIEEPITGISGTYLIKDANHTIAKGIHTMTLGLEVRNG